MTRRREKISAIDALQGLGRISDLIKKETEHSLIMQTPADVPISHIIPDPHQARRILPEGVREKYFRGELNPEQALEEWQQLAHNDKIEESIMESQILRLASSLKNQEQINPITISSIPGDPHNRYLLETGERRWWAHWWLFGVEKDSKFETIRAVVVEKTSPWRQAAENLQGEPLTAVQEACQIARLLLVEVGVEPDYTGYLSGEREGFGIEGKAWINRGYDFFRQATTHRVPKGSWLRIEQATGRGRRYCQYLLGLFNLCDGALVAAERHRLTESQLRPLASGENDPERQVKIIQLMIENDLGRAEVESLVKETNLDQAIGKIDRSNIVRKTSTMRAPEEIVVERLLAMTRLLDRASRSEPSMVRNVTHEMLQTGDVEKRRLELASLRSFIGELVEELDKAVIRTIPCDDSD